MHMSLCSTTSTGPREQEASTVFGSTLVSAYALSQLAQIQYYSDRVRCSRIASYTQSYEEVGNVVQLWDILHWCRWDVCNEQEREKAKALERQRPHMPGACIRYYVITIMATRLFNPHASIITTVLDPT
jgi:hypothetical protein